MSNFPEPGSRPADENGRSSWLQERYRGLRVLVAGGDGFLGSRCVSELLSLGARVSIVTRTRGKLRPSGVEAHVGDLRDAALVRQAVKGQALVFDFAGTAGAVDSNRQPERHLEEELRAQLTLFRACAESSESPRVLLSSSRLVYGKPRYLPVDENHPLSPQSIYAAHKLTAESYLSVFAQTGGLSYTVLRVSNPYGPDPSPGAKTYGVINQFLRQAARGERIRVFGSGEQLRDYVYVEDAIRVFLLCAVAPGCANQCFNLGGPEPVKLADAAGIIARLAGAPPVHRVDWPEDYRKVETGDYLSDLSKLRSFLTLFNLTPFEAGVSRSLEAYRQRSPANVVEVRT